MNFPEVPFLDTADKDFSEKLAFEIWSTGGSSDYRNDRDRPYNGQSWTTEGDRGKQEVKGLTMRDIRDCLIIAILRAAPCENYLKEEEWTKCWDFSSGEAVPTQYLLDRQAHPDFITVRAELGTWRPQDVYKIDFTKIDPLAIASNLTCAIEKMMGFYPNVPKG